MTIINRRTLMGGLATLPAVPAVASDDGAVGTRSADERLRHHLAMAAQAMHELVAEPGSRWWITTSGSAEKGTASYRAHRFDRAPDKEIKGLLIENMEHVSGGWL